MPEIDAPNKKKCATMVIIEEYPNGMTREEYQQHLRKYHIKFLARLILQHFPELITEAKANVELKEVA